MIELILKWKKWKNKNKKQQTICWEQLFAKKWCTMPKRVGNWSVSCFEVVLWHQQTCLFFSQTSQTFLCNLTEIRIDDSHSTLTRMVLRTASVATEEIAFTEMGISPRTRVLMGIRTDAPLWLPTDTWRALGIDRSSLSGKMNSKVSLSAIITMTWQQWEEGKHTQIALYV